MQRPPVRILPPWRRLPRSWRGLTLSLLVCASVACSTAYAQPSQRPAGAVSKTTSETLADLPADTLAAYVRDLTWLVEDLQADLRRADAMHALTTDTMQARIDFLRGLEQDDRHWLVESWEAVDQWVFSFVSVVLTLWAVELGVD